MHFQDPAHHNMESGLRVGRFVHKLQDCGFLVSSVCPQKVQLVQTTVDSMEGLILQRILEDFGILGLVPANW